MEECFDAVSDKMGEAMSNSRKFPTIYRTRRLMRRKRKVKDDESAPPKIQMVTHELL